MKAIKNHSGDFDIVGVDGNVVGEVTILGTWIGEALFEHTSRELLDLSDMARICYLMKMCSAHPNEFLIE